MHVDNTILFPIHCRTYFYSLQSLNKWQDLATQKILEIKNFQDL